MLTHHILFLLLFFPKLIQHKYYFTNSCYQLKVCEDQRKLHFSDHTFTVDLGLEVKKVTILYKTDNTFALKLGIGEIYICYKIITRWIRH